MTWSNGSKTAKRVQRATEWPYERALRFVKNRSSRKEANTHRRAQNKLRKKEGKPPITSGDALVMLAKACADVEKEEISHESTQ